MGVTITAQATVNVGASPQDVLKFVLDLDQYRQVDPKIQRVRSVEGPDDKGRGSAKVWGKVKGMPPPAMDVLRQPRPTAKIAPQVGSDTPKTVNTIVRVCLAN